MTKKTTFTNLRTLYNSQGNVRSNQLARRTPLETVLWVRSPAVWSAVLVHPSNKLGKRLPSLGLNPDLSDTLTVRGHDRIRKVSKEPDKTV